MILLHTPVPPVAPRQARRRPRRRGGATLGYYTLAAASFSLQIGAQSFSQAVFFITEDALACLDKSEGFELGADAKVARANGGLGNNVTTSTIQDPVIAFDFETTKPHGRRPPSKVRRLRRASVDQEVKY